MKTIFLSVSLFSLFFSSSFSSLSLSLSLLSLPLSLLSLPLSLLSVSSFCLFFLSLSFYEQRDVQIRTFQPPIQLWKAWLTISNKKSSFQQKQNFNILYLCFLVEQKDFKEWLLTLEVWESRTEVSKTLSTYLIW